MNPTFTAEPPTKPGWYAWKCGPQSRSVATEVLDMTSFLWCRLAGDQRGDEPNNMGGLWCRLVPAEEVKRAFMDGHARGISGTSLTSDERRDALAIDWFNSRAKRVMEGEVC